MHFMFTYKYISPAAPDPTSIQSYSHATSDQPYTNSSSSELNKKEI